MDEQMDMLSLFAKEAGGREVSCSIMCMKRWVSMLLALVMAVSLVSCGKNSGKGDSIRPKDGPSEAAERLCLAMQAYDFEKMNECLREKIDTDDLYKEDTAGLLEHFADILRGWAGEMTWTKEEPVLDGDGATVTVRFTVRDASPALNTAMTTFFDRMVEFIFSGKDQEAMIQELIKILDDAVKQLEPRTVEVPVTFRCVETADGWKVESLPEEAFNVLLANLMGTINNFDMPF